MNERQDDSEEQRNIEKKNFYGLITDLCNTIKESMRQLCDIEN